MGNDLHVETDRGHFLPGGRGLLFPDVGGVMCELSLKIGHADDIGIYDSYVTTPAAEG